MSDERDDEILGRALSRAIETQEANETPYERSRLAAQSSGRGFPLLQLVGAAATLVLALAVGSWLTWMGGTSPDVAASPPPALTATPAPSATAPAPSATTPPAAVDHNVLYVARLGLPPTAVRAQVPVSATTIEDRIASRITSLRALRPDAAPAGTVNFLWNNTFQGGVNVKIAGEIATVDLLLADKPWSIGSEDATTGILQQLVYTATEEPGIRAVLVTHDRGQQMRIGDFVFDQPLTRENVFGYKRVDPGFMGEQWSLACSTTPCPSTPIRLSSSHSVDYVGMGVTRFTIQVDSGQPQGFTIEPSKVDDSVVPWAGKYVMRIDIAGVEARPGLAVVERTPLRSVRSQVDAGRTTYELFLDDLRPWRVVTTRDPYRIVIDVGGYVASVSDSIAVYIPAPGDPPVRQFTVSGLARVFEGTVSWRIRDSAQRVVVNGFTTASAVTSQEWGTFQFQAQIPAGAAPGDLWLEVYWASPKDGSDQGLVRVRLKVG